MFIPSMLLKRLYTFSSLKNVPEGVFFSVKNRLSDAKLTAMSMIGINGNKVPLDSITLVLGDGTHLSPKEISPQKPIDFPLRQTIDIISHLDPLPLGKYKI